MTTFRQSGSPKNKQTKSDIADKRRAIEMVPPTEEGRQLTQGQLTNGCKVSRSYAAKVLGKHHRDDSPQHGQEQKRVERKLWWWLALPLAVVMCFALNVGLNVDLILHGTMKGRAEGIATP